MLDYQTLKRRAAAYQTAPFFALPYSRSASVLFALHQQQKDWNVVLTTRSQHLTHHSGEVAFPGGIIEAGESAEEAALRESWEEIALPPTHVEVVRPLSSLVSKWGVHVTSILGVIDSLPPLTANPDEIDQIFSVPMSHFVSANISGTTRSRHRERVVAVPEYHYQGHRIWGMTSYIITDVAKQLFDSDINFKEI
ncbi:NUDIX hydrolase [Umboniibacter marinipuniceus]|uniref:NUDIX domain-containing protein n=1 Tax=Umboniibacter marinipuniceus TaxID=569599 RepID=A0A3M0A8I9_9GAMM|nr:CoA pyrophosphatase [Umboniibacter marinipuniceus]RMA81423.1 NUDIX domain-containing protein [Umboniibacter marinipuniceus]